MNSIEILTAVLIHFIIPICGILYFLYLRDKMVRSGISNPPVPELFLIFAIYGVLLILVLTFLFWEWSAAAFLGTVFSVFVAPILMAFVSVRLKMAKPATAYHLVLQKAAIWYFFALAAGLIILFSFAKG